MIATALLAIVPVVLLISLGALLRRYALMADSFWPQAERLCYFLLLPALFAHALSTADLRGLPIADMALALIGATVMVAAALVIARPLMKVDNAAFTSIFQGGIRFNNYIGITAAVGLYGSSALALAALSNAIIVPTVNILCVLVFAHFGSARPTVLRVIKGIVQNPLIIGCAIGIALQITGTGIPPGVDSMVRALGQASLPIGLMCVGAAFERRALGSSLKPTLIASIAKFVMMPLTTVGTCLMLGVDGRAMTVAVLFQALPTASSSYMLALQTLLAMAVLPLVMIALLAR